MQIDIQPSKQNPGKWVVIAHREDGDIHDGLFSSQEAALEFALKVYGGKVVPVRPVPPTTPEKLVEYKTTRHSCQCPNAAHGGSYRWGNRFVCKHIYKVLADDFALANRVADAWFYSKQEHISKEGVLAA